VGSAKGQFLDERADSQKFGSGTFSESNRLRKKCSYLGQQKTKKSNRRQQSQPKLFNSNQVIDYDMPGMNGLELATELRRQGHGAPIAMVSGRIEPPNEPGAELLARFISKGEGADILLQTLLDLSPRASTKAAL
jgi:CheY-like chemotaxis protein